MGVTAMRNGHRRAEGLRLAVLTRAVTPLHGIGGLERSTYNLVQHLLERGARVDLFTRPPTTREPWAHDGLTCPVVALSHVPGRRAPGYDDPRSVDGISRLRVTARARGGRHGRCRAARRGVRPRREPARLRRRTTARSGTDGAARPEPAGPRGVRRHRRVVRRTSLEAAGIRAASPRGAILRARRRSHHRHRPGARADARARPRGRRGQDAAGAERRGSARLRRTRVGGRRIAGARAQRDRRGDAVLLSVASWSATRGST